MQQGKRQQKFLSPDEVQDIEVSLRGTDQTRPQPPSLWDFKPLKQKARILKANFKTKDAQQIAKCVYCKFGPQPDPHPPTQSQGLRANPKQRNVALTPKE